MQTFTPENLLEIAGREAASEVILREICEITSERARVGASAHTTAFSYFFEIVKRKPFPGEVSSYVAALAVRRFLRENAPGIRLPDESELMQFARRIDENVEDWDSFRITFLEPGEVDVDRIRRNLAMTPAERLERHGRLLKQLRILHEARARYRSSKNS